MTINEVEFEEFVFVKALENAQEHGGSANPKALLGRVIPKYPQVREDLQHYSQQISNIVEQVNSLSFEDQGKKLKKLSPEHFNKKPKVEIKKDGLPSLKNTEKGVKVRFEPAPSGFLHIGHLFPLVANYELKKKYGGKFILRIADTNPDNIDLANYDKVIEDTKWICENDITEIAYQSKRLDIYYKYLRILVEKGFAYVCQCDVETFKTFADSKQKCPHCALSLEEQQKLYDKFMNGGFGQGEAVVRFKADIENKNPALRAFTLARINSNEHAKTGTKYSVWPTMHLAVALDDAVMKITHVIRGKDHETNMQRQMMVHKVLGFKSPEYFHMGRMKFEDVELSKTRITELIEQGTYESWEDPRVPSLVSFRKQGYKAQAFRSFVLSLGISKRDSKITLKEYLKGLDYYNKQILEKEANRFFFVFKPREIIIDNITDFKEKEIELPKHPEDKSRGLRHFKTSAELSISAEDFDVIVKGERIRLMHFGNFEVISKDKKVLHLKFLSQNLDKSLNIKRLIHYLPKYEQQDAEIVMQDNSKLDGKCENLGNIKEDTVIQFERFGFVRFDHTKKNGTKVFYYTHS